MANYIPKYLVEKDSVIWTVCGTALFAELFILIYQPFGSRGWTESEWIFIGFATLAVLVAMAIIAISRTILFFYAKKHHIAYWEYAIWIAVELLAMALTYSLFPILALHKQLDFLLLFREALIDTFFIVLIPYTVVTLSFILKARTEELNQLKADTSKQSQTIDESSIINFHDEKGDLKISIRSDALYYIESADNYVVIYYKNGDKISKFLLRNSLKQIEDSLALPGIVRCHRSYIVNLARVKMLCRNKEGLEINFMTDGIPALPISKTYSAKVIERFQ